jgi:uncharacterized protein (TIGR02466 family)
MDHLEIFPTNVFRWGDVLNANDFQLILDAPLEDKQPVDIPFLSAFIHNATREIMQKLQINPAYEIEITEMWANVSPPGKEHAYHNHPNNVFSGIYYLTDGIPTTFVDPRPANNVFQVDHRPSKHMGNMLNMRAVPNSLVIFDGWLYHYVAVNNTQDTRKSVSFNIIFRGDYGLDNSLAKVRI